MLQRDLPLLCKIWWRFYCKRPVLFVEAHFKPSSISSFLYAGLSLGRSGKGLLRKFSSKGNQGLSSQFLWGSKSWLEIRTKIRPFSPSEILFSRWSKRSWAPAAVILPVLCLYIDLWITGILLLIKIISLCVVHKLYKCVLRFTVAVFCFPFCPSKPKAIQLVLLLISANLSKSISPE